VNGDKVRLLEEFIKLDRTGHLVTGQTPSGFKRKDWIVTDDVHAKAERGVDDAVAKSNKSKHVSRDSTIRNATAATFSQLKVR
jgi:hypothetical protein